MGILTTNDSARAFSSYVTAFGLALLISSIIYLKRLDKWVEERSLSSPWSCLPDNLAAPNITTGSILCSQLTSWRSAAIVGIIIGVIDTLIVPFLCCCLCCTACGCAVCVAVGCPEVFTDNSPKKSSDETRNGDAEAATAINLDEDTTPEPTSKYDIEEKIPSKLHKWMNAIGWIFWVLSPFLATLFIVVSLYRSDAIRTPNDLLFNSALSLFVIALFNLMVFFQKFMNSVCGYGHEKITKN